MSSSRRGDEKTSSLSTKKGRLGGRKLSETVRLAVSRRNNRRKSSSSNEATTSITSSLISNYFDVDENKKKRTTEKESSSAMMVGPHLTVSKLNENK